MIKVKKELSRPYKCSLFVEQVYFGLSYLSKYRVAPREAREARAVTKEVTREARVLK